MTTNNNTETEYAIKDWFHVKMENRGHFRPCQYFDACNIVRETEKAILVVLEYTAGNDAEATFETWMPKAAVQTRAAYKEETAAYVEKVNEKFEAGKNRYNDLIQFCKENGVKGVRVGLRTETILGKIAEAGLEYKA